MADIESALSGAKASDLSPDRRAKSAGATLDTLHSAVGSRTARISKTARSSLIVTRSVSA